LLGEPGEEAAQRHEARTYRCLGQRLPGAETGLLSERPLEALRLLNVECREVLSASVRFEQGDGGGGIVRALLGHALGLLEEQQVNPFDALILGVMFLDARSLRSPGDNSAGVFDIA
jgi:hypothetical protein